jgi:NADPH2:quinone reductase
MPTIPSTMRAAALDRFGGPEMLKLHMMPVPIPGPDEILIAVHTAGVGVWDADIRKGWSPSGDPARFPLVLGSDGSGTVAAVGANVECFAVGDIVYSFAWDNPKGGFYAEYAAVPWQTAARVPERLDLEHAGALPVTGLTALQGIDDHLHLTAGETVIIHGAAGGVGTIAVQFAKLREAHVFATATDENGLALLRRLGADYAIDGRRDDIVAAARSFAPGGVDAVLALAGGAELEHCLDALRENGRVAFPNGVEPVPKPRQGIVITPYDGVAGIAEFERLDHAIAASKLEVVVAAGYPLEDAVKAHERFAAGHVLGKLVLHLR